MNPLMRQMQSRQAATASHSKPQHRPAKKNQRRPPPPTRNRLMSTPLYLQAAPCGSSHLAPVPTSVNYDDKLTHLSGLFPNIDNSIIMDILIQKRGSIEAATSDLFQLTNPGMSQMAEQASPPEFDSVELPPCYDELDLAYNFEKEFMGEFASLPVSLKETQMLKKHDLRKNNSSLALPISPFKPPQQKEYLKQWKRGEMCWVSVNGKKVLIGPLPITFLRVQRPVYTRSQSATLPATIQSPLYRHPPPMTPGPSQEINEAREGRISPFRLPLKLEQLDITDPDEAENQVFEDWKLANYLQNLEFVSRVEENRDLYASLRLAANASDQTQRPLYDSATLKRLDKGTKKKLTKLARKISRENAV